RRGERLRAERARGALPERRELRVRAERGARAAAAGRAHDTHDNREADAGERGGAEGAGEGDRREQGAGSAAGADPGAGSVEVTRATALVILACALAMPAAALPPRIAWGADASAMDEARAHYSKGVQLYNEGSYDAALVELERANKLAPSYRILYSIGLVKLR